MIECPQCQSTNSPTAARCATCGVSFDFNAATIATTSVITPPPRPPAPASTEAFAKNWSLPAPAGVVGSASFAPGTVLGTRYEILQLLGQGGMGAVYKAKDLELDRVVALKVIRPELAIHPEILQRFKQELILARQITHRNVIRIFDLSEAGGIKFITMEFIEGQDLKSLVTEKGRLSPEETVRIMEQVCLALETAHSEGVVHRDLKPQNIMIDRMGRVAVMDFGIARSVETGGMTQTGMLVGTPDYMSPEQVMGERVDVRSDLFAIGVILYELLSGSLPYKADSPQAAMYKRTREAAKPLSVVQPSVPPLLSDVVAKCLQIDPKLRYQSAGEIRGDLEAWRHGAEAGSATVIARRPPLLSREMKRWTMIGGAVVLVTLAGWFVRGRFASSPSSATAQAPAPPAVSLAFLPFRNQSGDATLDWLGSSIAETLSTDVGQSSHLRVVSSERVGEIFRDLRLSGDTSLDPATIQRVANFSNADNVVSGSYARFGDTIRVNATLQDVKTSRATSLSESAPEKDILSAIDHLAADIRSNLSLSTSIVKELEGRSFKPSTNSIPALRDYNVGLQDMRGANYLDAVKQFQASTQEDPNFALAFSELSRTYAALGQDNDAEEASRKAVELSSQLPEQEKYVIQAAHYQVLRDYPKAIAAFEALAQAQPSNSDVLFNLGTLYENAGQYDKARAELSKMLSFDPNSATGLLESGRVEIRAGNPQKGLEYLARAQALAIESGNEEQQSEILQSTGQAYADLGKNDDAIRNYQDSLKIKQKLGLKKGIAESLHAMATSEIALGHPDQALKNYNAALDLWREIGDRAGTGDLLNDLGQFYSDRGQYDQALKLFKESLQDEIDTGNENNQGLVLTNIGNGYALKGDYQNARTYYEQALQVREKLKVSSDIADTLHNLGDTLCSLGQYDQALTYYERAMDLRRSDGDRRGVAIESSSLGALFSDQGRYGAALSSQQDAVKTMRDIKEQGFWLADVLGSYGEALAQVGKADDAEKSLQEALTIARQQNDGGQLAKLLGFDGDNAFYRGDYKSAAALYAQALQQASRSADPQMILTSKINAARVAVKQGRFAEATQSLRSLAREADSRDLQYASTECSIYLAEALIGAKSYALAQTELKTALNSSERLGLQSLLAQGHFLLGRAFEGAGHASDARDQYRQAAQIADSIRKEAQTATIATRSDLHPIYAHPA
jgi:eukaryotic-like serine/threonine-protein kinase